MKIYNSKKFVLGLVLIALSYIPFSYMNHGRKHKIENCDRIDGAIREVNKTHTKYGRHDGLTALGFGLRYIVIAMRNTENNDIQA